MKDFDREICSAQVFTSAAVSENTWNVDAAGKNLGNSQIYCHFQVGPSLDFAGLGSGVNIYVVDSAAEALSGDRAIAMFTTTNASDAGLIAVTDLTAGTHLICALPPGIANLQYLGISFVPGGAAASGGATVNAWFDTVAGEVDLQ